MDSLHANNAITKTDILAQMASQKNSTILKEIISILCKLLQKFEMEVVLLNSFYEISIYIDNKSSQRCYEKTIN